jgi:hypothetical protein
MTRCLDHERSILDAVIARIESHGYQPSISNTRLWTRGPSKIVVCLVDDIRSASTDYETDMPYLFDRDTTVITDNFLTCPVQFNLLPVPPSFFHIYGHDQQLEWIPDRSFSFSVNRIDDRRFRLMLELGKRAYLDNGYVNFNCQLQTSDPHPVDHALLRQRFESCWMNLSQQDQENYSASYSMLAPLMPVKNYGIDHEDMHLRSRCNMVVESYGSDTSVAFSEKIFRALQVPVPWTLYGGHYAVAYLESLGFDCMSDIINHNHYDQLKEIEDKARIFIWFSLKWARECMAHDHVILRDRCRAAADHNRALLASYRETWQEDFDHWMINLDRRLSSR